MPYYAWKGVDFLGKNLKGKQFAHDHKELDQLLLNRNIALIHAKEQKQFLPKPITRSQKIASLVQLQALLEANILLPEALAMVARNIQHPVFAQQLDELAQQVKQGRPLEVVLEQMHIFPPIVPQVLAIGQESAQLPATLKLLIQYLQQKEQFSKKLRATAMMPLITLGFFLFFIVAIFGLIIPHFVPIFRSFDKPLPALTKKMIALSNFMSSWYALGFIMVLIIFGIALYQWQKSKDAKRILDKLILRLPYSNNLVKHSQRAQLFSSLALLTQAHVPLVPALKLAQKTMTNTHLQELFQEITNSVEQGYSLSDVMQHDQSQLIDQEIIAMISVGQESGNLGIMLQKAAHFYKQKAEESFQFISTIFQPLLLIILGLLVALLVFSVYLPILQVSDVM